MEPRILVVDDEPALVTTLRDRLIAEGYAVEDAADGEAGLGRALGRAFDLIILDLMLPKKDGMAVCRDLRSRGIAAPVLMLTARGELTDRVAGLKIGADDYLVKPFEMPELLARVEALLRRPRGLRESGEDFLCFGPFRLDFRRSTLFRTSAPARRRTRGGNAGPEEREVPLTAQEYRLLAHFAAHRGEVLSRDQLLDAVWGYDRIPTTRTVDVHVAWLRQKIEDNPAHPRRIVTMRRRGYRFSADPPAPADRD